LDCFDKYPPNNGLIGENLAEVILPEYDYFNAWMLSESHRDNVLEPRYTRYGIATKGRYTAITFSE
jgi:uncharacterized protein YkwD